MKDVTNTGLPEWANVIAVFYTETTGIAPETTRIVSANVSVLNPYGEVEDEHNWLIDCGIEIPGITADQRVRSGMKLMIVARNRQFMVQTKSMMVDRHGSVDWQGTVIHLPVLVYFD